MLTYQDVVTIRLTPLTTAAASWDEMADGFEDLGEAYGGSVQAVSTDGGWVGLSAEAAKARFTATRKQFDAAAVEARAIAAILRDIYAQFTEQIQAVRHLVESAKEADIHIDAKGQAHLDTSKSKGATGGIFGDDARRAIHEASWTSAVAAAVQAVDDADQGAKMALRDAAGIKGFFEEMIDNARGTGHEFNAAQSATSNWSRRARPRSTRTRSWPERNPLTRQSGNAWCETTPVTRRSARRCSTTWAPRAPSR